MTTSVLFFLIQKPAALSAPQWATATNALFGFLGKADGDPQPFKRLHTRARLDGQAYIIAATFDTADLDVTDVTKLPQYISTALSGAFTPTQVKTALVGNTTVFSGIGATWEESRVACCAFLIANTVAWDGP